MRWILVCAVLCCSLADARSRIDYNGAMDRAKAAVQSGNVDPERDLVPVLEAYVALAGESGSSYLTYSLHIDDLAEADGKSPQAVKRWFRENAARYLLPLLESKAPAGPRGRVLVMLVNMQVDDATLDRAIEIASRDPELASSVERARADRKSNPVVTLAPVDPERERAAIAFLSPLHIGVNADSLRKAAGQGDVRIVTALLDAGVDANALGIARMNAVGATVSIGCIDRVPAEDLVAILRLLAERGAAIGGADPNGDTYLLGAARNGCPPAVIEALIDLGEPPDSRGSRGLTPLEMAIAAANIDAAEVLVARGARLTQERIDKLFIEPPSDPRVKALVERAKRGTP